MTFLLRHKLAFALSAAALIAMVWIVVSVLRNQARRLDLPRLEAARELWERQGPASYRLRYTILRTGSTEPDRYEVEVVDGKAVSAKVNDIEQEAARLHHYGMDRLFGDIERFLKIDEKAPPGQTTHLADFGERDGRLLWYYRRELKKRESVEIRVEDVE